MRISAQQIQVQMKDLKLGNHVQLKSGDVFSGKVLAIQTEAILLQLGDGASLRALVQSPERFVEGQNLELIVTEEPEAGLVKVAINSESMESKIEFDQIKQTFESVDLKVTKTHVEAFEMLKSLNIDVTKENIQKLAQNYKYVAKIAESTGSEKDLELISKTLAFDTKTEMLSKPIKDIVIRLLNLPLAEKGNDHVKENLEIKSQNPEMKEMPKETTPLKTVNEKIEVLEKQVTSLKDAIGLIKDESGKPVLENTLEKLGLLLKLDKPVTMQTLQLMDKMMMGDESVGNLIKDLIEETEIKSNPKLLALLKGFDFKSDQEDIKTYFNELLKNLDQAKPMVSSRLEKSMDRLSEQIIFLNKEQDDVSWMQVPVQFNQKTENLDIYIKHDKKASHKLSKENAKILLALNTDNLGLVQALVHVKGKSLDLNFTFEEEDILNIFTKGFVKLEKSFEEEFDFVTINGKVKGKITFREFMEDDSIHHINVRV